MVTYPSKKEITQNIVRKIRETARNVPTEVLSFFVREKFAEKEEKSIREGINSMDDKSDERGTRSPRAE